MSWRTLRGSGPEIALLAIAGAPRFWAAWNDQGVLWADEIFQSVEQAHRLVFGVGMIPWEFRDGARSWIFPGVLSVVLKLASFVTSNGLGLMRAVKLFMAILSVVAIACGMQLARRLAGRGAGWMAAAFIGGFPALIVFAPRAMSEMASGAAIAVIAYLLVAGGNRRSVWAGVLGGLATFVRVQNGVAVLALALVPAFRRRWSNMFAYSGGGLLGAGMAALLDWATWGEPYHSIWTNVKFNVIEGRAVAGWGSSPWNYYFETLWTSTGWPIFLVALGLLCAIPRASALVIAVALTLGAHVAIEHKEFRFIMPIMPLALATAAVGIAQLFTWLRWRGEDLPVRWLVAAGFGALLAWPTPDLTQAKMGSLVNHPNGRRSVWHHDEERNLALAEVSKHADACGVAFPEMAAVSTGGYSYLHRRIPVAWGSGETPAANYYISTRDPHPPPGFTEVRNISDVHWVFRRDGGCTPMTLVENM